MSKQRRIRLQRDPYGRASRPAPGPGANFGRPIPLRDRRDPEGKILSINLLFDLAAG